MAEVHVRTLRRAAEVVGGERKLALHLRVARTHLHLWLDGLADPPAAVFLRAVDVVIDADIAAWRGNGDSRPEAGTKTVPDL